MLSLVQLEGDMDILGCVLRNTIPVSCKDIQSLGVLVKHLFCFSCLKSSVEGKIMEVKKAPGCSVCCACAGLITDVCASLLS